MNFKKKLMALSVVSSMTLGMYVPAFAASNSINLQVNGVQNIEKASLIDGKSYIKVSDVKEILGLDSTVSGTKLKLDGDKSVDVTTIDGTEYVVIRDLATAEDYMLGWDGDEKTVVIVDTDRINTSKFTIIEKYMNGVNEATPKLSKTTGTFSGSVETLGEDATKVPFSGTVTGLSNETVANVDMSLKLDLKEIKKLAETEDKDKAVDAVEQAMYAALEDSNTKVIFDTEKGMYYINSSLFSTLGVEDGTWISIDFNELLGASATQFDFKSIVELASKGDFKGYIDGVIKSIPVDSVESYDEIKAAYDEIAKMMGDDSFTLKDGKYTSNYTVNEDGTEITYTMTFNTDKDKVTDSTVKLTMKADGQITMDVEAASDKDLNTTMKINMNIADMMKLYMEYKSATTATTETPISVPASDKIVSFDSLLGGMLDEEIEAETAGVEAPVAEEPATAEVPAETATPAATTETPAETATPAATTETPVETATPAATAETPVKTAA